MTNNSPKHIAFKTLIKNKSYLLDNYTDLRKIIEFNQFTIIEYKKYSNSKPVSELIKRLKIEDEIEKNDSFVYINNNLKFVFINADVSDKDKCALLRHELGHICDPDFKNGSLHHSKIQKEEFANEFSFYAKNPGICFMLYIFIIKKWKLLISLMALIFALLAFSFINFTFPAKPVTEDAVASVISNDVYYVTSSGKKYHRKHCIIIKYKNNLTQIKLTDAINDGYKPCMICNPKEE